MLIAFNTNEEERLDAAHMTENKDTRKVGCWRLVSPDGLRMENEVTGTKVECGEGWLNTLSAS
jgi:hypothetical protein